jgi:pyridoxamine 5'-phosphate oxidase
MEKVRFDTPMSIGIPSEQNPAGKNVDLSREAISAMRRSYGEVGLTDMPADPFETFNLWLGDAVANAFIVEANAMVLSTLGSDQNGNDAITTRTVLLKDISQGGFTFFTNYNSRKSAAIEIHKSHCYFLGIQWKDK